MPKRRPSSAERVGQQADRRHAVRPGDAAGDGPHPCPRRRAQSRDRRAALGDRRRTERTRTWPGSLNLPGIYAAQAGLIEDMDFVARKLSEAFPAE